MNIRIKNPLAHFFWLFCALLPASASDLPGMSEGFRMRRFGAQVYYDAKQDSHEIDILNLPQGAWQPLPSPEAIPPTVRTAWLKIPLPEGSLGQELYLTEHSGLSRWEIFFFSENLLLDQDSIDWSSYEAGKLNPQSQFRGFTSFQIFNSNHNDVVLLIRMEPDITNQYDFYLRGRLNFQQIFSRWLFVQGVGMGLIVVVLLLTLIMSIRLRYKIDWLYLVLVIFSGLNISYITGLGPQFTARFLPWISPIVWILALGLFNVFSVQFIEEFADLPERYKHTRTFFTLLKGLTILSLIILPFVPRLRVFLILNVITIILLFLILAGLTRLIVLKVSQAAWLLSGWSLLLFITAVGYVGKIIMPDNVSLAVVSYIFGQAILLIFLGASLIKQMDEQRLKESVRRRSAEHVAESVVKRMGDHKRMADLGAMVSSVTHELGTPLGVTVTLSSNMTNTGRNIDHLFREGELSEDDFRTFLSDVLESSELIEKNMESARILMDGFKQVAADQAAPDLRELNLKQYVAQFIRIMMTQVKKTPYNLVQSIRDDLYLHTIPGILTQVLTNLVNNAIIHGFKDRDKGTVLISAEKVDREGREQIQIRVEDNGVGIPPEIQKKVFNMYFTTKKGLGGTGIGLSIVKSLVEERLTGSITLNSEEGKGTIFSILLPVDLKDNL